MQAAGEESRSDNHAWRDELFAAISRRDTVSFWDCMPPHAAVITRRFLRDEDADVSYDDG